MLVALIAVCFAGQCLYMNVAALVPQFVEEFYPEANSLSVAILLSAYPLCFIITAGVAGDKLLSIGRRTGVLIGVLSMAAATTSFGLAGYIKNSFWFFFGISFLARAI